MELVTSNMEHNNSKEFVNVLEGKPQTIDAVPLANHWTINEMFVNMSYTRYYVWNGDSQLANFGTYNEAMMYVRRNANAGDTLRIEATIKMVY